MPQFIGIATDNLMLRPFSPAELLALHEGDEQFSAESHLTPCDGLRAMLVSDEVSPAWLERLRASVDRDPWRFGFVVLETMTGIALKPPDVRRAFKSGGREGVREMFLERIIREDLKGGPVAIPDR